MSFFFCIFSESSFEEEGLAFSMHLALSIMHPTLLSANMIALFDDISVISFSPILATLLGSNPEKASLYVTNSCHQRNVFSSAINVCVK